MVAQRTDAWLKAATPEQIHAAHRAGELDTLLQGGVPDGQAAAQRNESSDAAAANALGITVEQFQQIESPGTLAAIAAHLNGAV
jgi:hypothetical protein